ncbi:nitroreductase family deazaflavin-dependent oxidoreductase [Pedococcus sp. 5OH_020]|uniref:nitroreductase family deazaflavin-dependent oxidoreductase n=1 Tax=Pedococcus sp. 5OH_020 TaxID=2989814 RepID=UPI0022E9F48A|nr:nitroreductase family deazaflavin-dependent oxidoreductase [Pedococcus sp. 5OH_020]
MNDTKKSAATGPPAWAVRASEPVARLLAGRRWFPIWAVVHHRGRRSGKEYAVPVAIIPTGSSDTMLIGLPWGTTTNWARNVLAAGGATVTWKGREYAATEPRLVGAEVAAAQAKGPVRRLVGSGRFPAFLQLTYSRGSRPRRTD